MGAATSPPLDGPAPARRRLRGWVALLLSVALLAWTAARTDVERVAARLAEARPLWAMAALAASVPAVLLPALRWSYTASRLGLRVAWRRAWREYYVSTFLNQVLPGGIAGDVVRAVRHRREVDPAVHHGPSLAVKAVVLERVSNQLAFWALLAVALPAWTERPSALLPRALGWAAAAASVLLLAWLAVRRWAAIHPWGRVILQTGADVARALFAGGAFAVHALISGATLLSLGVMYACATAAVGVPLDLRTALRIVPLLLGASVLPAVFAGWGLREASAAALYGLAGLSPEDGTAASVLYGLLSLLASLPGLWFLVAASWPYRLRRPT